ncbi:MAG: ribonuclease PH [Promethearchaeia archaeon]
MADIKRLDGRKYDEIRKVEIIRNYLKFPEGSVLISQGDTKVIITASVQESVPRFLVDTGKGWITAEYDMLPRATQVRNSRERERLRVKGRTHEIQRLIGRSMRAAFNYEKLGERTIKIDCDVIQADGGTRCACITGAFIAVFDAINYLYENKIIHEFPDYKVTAAISVGIKDNEFLLDLDYSEDSKVDVDFNIVMNEDSEFIELQGTAEGATFDKKKLEKILDLGKKGVQELIKIQKKVLNL